MEIGDVEGTKKIRIGCLVSEILGDSVSDKPGFTVQLTTFTEL